jgi:hypothetical protein
MSRDLPNQFVAGSESAVTSPDRVSSTRESRHLTVVPTANGGNSARLTRGQVASRLDISVSTVRRYEGERLHPLIDDKGVRWFEEKEVAALAAQLINESGKRPTAKNEASARATEHRTAGEIAALVFERFEERQSLAEIVIGLRVEPDLVAQLFDQYSRGLTERQLRKREPNVPLVEDIAQVHRSELDRRLGAIPPNETTRISISRWRGQYPAGEDRAEYAWLIEVGGFYVSGPCTADEIVRRYGPGSYRVTAYGFVPSRLLWEVLVEGLVDGK